MSTNSEPQVFHYLTYRLNLQLGVSILHGSGKPLSWGFAVLSSARYWRRLPALLLAGFWWSCPWRHRLNAGKCWVCSLPAPPFCSSLSNIPGEESAAESAAQAMGNCSAVLPQMFAAASAQHLLLHWRAGEPSAQLPPLGWLITVPPCLLHVHFPGFAPVEWVQTVPQAPLMLQFVLQQYWFSSFPYICREFQLMFARENQTLSKCQLSVWLCGHDINMKVVIGLEVQKS